MVNENNGSGSGEGLPEDGVPAAGSEAHASGPSPQEGAESGDGDDLTVDDILGAEQTSDAAGADTGESRSGESGSGESGSGESGSGESAGGEDAESSPYLEDLRRLTAEYANYRKRTEANAEVEKQRSRATVVSSLLPVLDDLDRAEQHGDLEEGSAFSQIAQKLRGTLEKLGLESFGEKGEAFDPKVHEAIAQVPVPGTEQHTVLDVIERGYRIGEVELRPAKVAVAVGADG